MNIQKYKLRGNPNVITEQSPQIEIYGACFTFSEKMEYMLFKDHPKLAAG